MPIFNFYTPFSTLMIWRTTTPWTITPSFWRSLIAAFMVPPVAKTSSMMRTLSPGFTHFLNKIPITFEFWSCLIHITGHRKHLLIIQEAFLIFCTDSNASLSSETKAPQRRTPRLKHKDIFELFFLQEINKKGQLQDLIAKDFRWKA